MMEVFLLMIDKIIPSKLQQVIIPVEGKQQDIAFKKEVKPTTHSFNRNEFNKITTDKVTVAIPTYSFYDEVTKFNYSYENDIAKVHDGSIPLHKSLTLTFVTTDFSAAEQKHLFIGRVYKNGYVSYRSSKRKDGKLYLKTKSLGNYKLALDTKKPTITPKGFKDKQWLTNFRYLKLKIKDDLSGIKSYKATIDGKWVLMEYESKTKTLTYDFNDNKVSKKTKGAKHTLKVTVTDNVNNKNTYIATFYRK